MALQGKLGIWQWLLTNARKYPFLIGGGLFLILCTISLIVGKFIGNNEEWFSEFSGVIENTTNILGWLSMMIAFALALLAWAQRKESAISFYGAGSKVDKIKDSFEASLILASRHAQTDWHLRHIQPKRMELVWTPLVAESKQELIERFEDIECRSSQENSLSNEEAYDIIAIKKHCIALLTDICNKYDKKTVCVDLTAGTALMTVAAFQAAEEMGVTSIYLLGKTSSKQGFIIDNDKVHEASEATIVIVSDHRKH